METHTCVYCGAPATYRFKNGNWCCSVNRQSCPTYRAKIAQSVADRHAEAKVKYGSALFSHQHSVAKTGIAATTKYPSRGDHICVYCGGHADYQLKDGRWCCHEKKGSCPEIRRKNSEGCKKSFQNGRRGKGRGRARGSVPWNKGLPSPRKGKNKYNDPVIAKQVATIRAAYANGRKGTWFGRHHTEEQKRKLREIRLEQRAKHGMKIYSPNVSETACAYIDQLNESKGWHLQHGLNGGEVRVDNYFLDGYDKELNIAFEYDEPAHYTEQGELRERDVFRMNHIHQKLGCRFFRYNEARKLLYEVQF